MADNTDRMLGQLDGKLDTLMQTIDRWQVEHNARHEKIDEKLEAHAQDINQAKGAKAGIIAAAATLSAFVGVAIAAADRFLK